MINNLNEVNRILVAILMQAPHGDSALESSVIEYCRSIVIDGNFPNHKETIDLCIESGIIRRVDERLRLTRLGKKLAELNTSNAYEFNEKQKNLFIKSALLGKAQGEVRRILKHFTLAYSRGTFQWSNTDNLPVLGNPSILNAMQQSGFLTKTNEVLSVNQAYVRAARDLLATSTILTPEKLCEKLKIAQKVGEIAEKVVLEYEQNRLQMLGCYEESECIEHISALNVSAGYDIVSFNGKNSEFRPDRYIEVKGSSDKNVTFYISANELKQAAILRTNYWIYFVPGINIKKRSSSTPPILIQDPVRSIIQNPNFNVDCTQFEITAKEQPN